MGRVTRDAENGSFYDAFSRVQSLDHANPSQKTSGHTKITIFPRVQSLDRPIHCINRCVAPHGWKNVQFYLAFLTLTYRIPGKGCALRLKYNILRRVQSHSVARPGQSIIKNRGAERFDKIGNFTSRSVPRPYQSIVKIDVSRLTN